MDTSVKDNVKSKTPGIKHPENLGNYEKINIRITRTEEGEETHEGHWGGLMHVPG